MLGLLLLCLALCVRCAKVLVPEGGPKDETPPQLLRAKPEPFTVNFTGNEIRLYFDEMVTTKEFQKGVQVSPPLKYPLVATDRGKSISLKFSDTLRSSSTYRIDLSGVVVDLAEGNKATNCVYVFSTGQSIDSGLVVGVARDAFTHNPVENVSVQLYATDSPRAAVDSFPLAVARTQKEGNFRVENLPEGTFQVVALADANGNRKYDLPTEQIAFLDTLVRAARMPKFVDTLARQDSVSLLEASAEQTLPNGRVPAADSTLGKGGSDSSQVPLPEAERIASVRLNLFSYERPKQILQKRERLEAGLSRLIFACPPEGEVRIETVAPVGANFVEERSVRGDTIMLWASNEVARNADTLFLHVHSLRNDSLYTLRPWVDTLRLGFNRKKAKNAKKFNVTNGKDSLDERMKLPIDILDAKMASAIKPNDTLIIRTKYPYAALDSSKVRLIANADTTDYPFALLRFDARPRDLGITARWPADSSFTLVVDSGALQGYFGECNDSVAFQWKTYKPSDYSALHFSLANTPKPCILQLYTDVKEKKTVREVIVRGDDEKVSILYLRPGTYYLRIVDDVNGDGKWTTGDFENRLQPEPVRYYVTSKGEKEIKTRANWEYDINVDYSVLEE